ncbi:Hsp70 family protein [Prosthecobacter sp.]
MNILGIDFGTTKTLAARWDERSQTARLIRLGRSGDVIPTTIYSDKSGKLEFGEDADDMRAMDGAGWKGRIKRDLGKGNSIVLNGHPHRVVDLVAGYLSYILKRAEDEVFHGLVDRAVITVPALYGPAEREELHQAAVKAGFKAFELLDEPVAAGLAFLHDKTGTELGESIMVFDWGGGTLDLTLVERQEGEFRVNHKWIGGDKSLGGEDIDDTVIERVDGLCSNAHGRVDEQDDQMRLHIQRNLKEGKELLSRRSEHTFRLRFKQPIELKWNREEFETLTATAVNRALDCLREQLRKMTAEGIKPKQVLLIGGSSSMPVIKRRIEDELGIKPILWEHSQTAVALGAALKPTYPQVNKNVLCIDVGCTRIKAAVFVENPSLEALTATKSVSITSLGWLNHSLPELLSPDKCNGLSGHFGKNQIRYDRISISVPGPVDNQGQFLRDDLTGPLINCPRDLKKQLQQVSGKSVHVVKDADAWLLGFLQYERLKLKKTQYPVLLMAFGTGIGVSIADKEERIYSVELSSFKHTIWNELRLVSGINFAQSFEVHRIIGRPFFEWIEKAHPEWDRMRICEEFSKRIRAAYNDFTPFIAERFGKISTLVLAGGNAEYINFSNNKYHTDFQVVTIEDRNAEIKSDLISLLGVEASCRNSVECF